MRKTVFLIITLILLSACDNFCGFSGCFWSMRVTNNSDHDVVFCVHLKKINDEEYRLSTGWPEALDEHMLAECPRESISSLHFYPYKYVKHSKEDSLTVFVFSPDTLKKYSYEEIKRTNNYLKRFDNQLKDFYEGGIVYP